MNKSNKKEKEVFQGRLDKLVNLIHFKSLTMAKKDSHYNILELVSIRKNEIISMLNDYPNFEEKDLTEDVIDMFIEMKNILMSIDVSNLLDYSYSDNKKLMQLKKVLFNHILDDSEESFMVEASDGISSYYIRNFINNEIHLNLIKNEAIKALLERVIFDFIHTSEFEWNNKS